MARILLMLLAAGAMVACGGTPESGADASADASDPGPDSTVNLDAGPDPDGGPQPDAGSTCPQGVICVDTFPFTDNRDTALEGESALDGYSCAPTLDESGPEIVYRVTVSADGFLSAAVYEQPGVDVDVHILSNWDAATCVDRGNHDVGADVSAGEVWVVIDTYVSGGVEQSGPFRVDIGFVEPSRGPCDMEVGDMPRVGDGGNTLAMPATGPMVLEAHLVTDQEPAPYPTTPTEELDAHYALSQLTTGLVMYRDQLWAPLEGGTFYGAGIGSPTDFPTLDEGWYVNMYWTAAARPEKGDRMILRDPNGGSRAVVVAAGYETGPGNLSNIGGTTEETHFYLDTGHLSDLQLGIAVDQSLPLGPRVCE